jgi:hypothetical protein
MSDHDHTTDPDICEAGGCTLRKMCPDRPEIEPYCNEHFLIVRPFNVWIHDDARFQGDLAELLAGSR